MGLDMYFNAKRYLSEYIETDAEIQSKVKEIASGFIDEWKPKEITYEVGYWRKANQIHNWFVQNVQDGEDDCKEYYVTPESIIELYEVVSEVLASGSKEVALDKLPPQSGFFFGGTQIDEYYWEDLEHTKQVLQPLIDAFNEANELGYESYKHPVHQFEFYYRSSW